MIMDGLTAEVVERIKTLTWVEATNSRLRAPFQELRARRTLTAYREIAARENIEVLHGDRLQQALRARLAERLRNRAPRVKGNLHIFAAYPGESWVKVLPTALQAFGKVTDYDYVAHGYVRRSLDEWIQRRVDLDRDMLRAFREAHAADPVDVVIGYLSGASTAPETLQEMASAGAVIFNFCWDDKLAWPGTLAGGRYTSPAAIAAQVDLNLTNSPDSIVKYSVHGGLAMFWPEAALPEVHRPHDVEFDYDVSFVGTRYGWRPRFIDRLRSAGIAVECFGPGWSNGPLSDEEMIVVYSKSRINLGFAGVGHSKRLMCLKGRDFEVPMSGGLYLTQHNPELALVFDVGKDIVTFQNEQDCIAKIASLLRDPVRCADIRRAGRARCLRDHTYETRWSHVLRFAGLLV
jgi:hypothetical protein